MVYLWGKGTAGHHTGVSTPRPKGSCTCPVSFGVFPVFLCALLQVVHAINDILLQRVIRLRDVDAIVASFAALGFRTCRGVLDATHIPICALEHRAAHFINQKGYFSIVLQALANHHGCFTDMYVGWSGRAHDEVGTFFPQQEFTVGDVHMPLSVVWDTALHRTDGPRPGRFQ